ncbi:MAG: bifunctional [glutamine synthetase] adenylyltransferase/[glutamine synthetase]-adenylyl-L-tyrosine phosphorylase, partial [Alphaproteobacteria bacterium]|nr:bifunctional [glutamine synthetase] adenylyltransferase/[glutamine synthetase]-adenylyl-L-tyrosine phosphorylase [Alphaproteobacteria bacterium]
MDFCRAGRSRFSATASWGGRILTPASDLDLVLVADHGRCEFSDGAKPLPPPLWFARLAQRLLSALTSPTASGDLYQVDMRLRPMGAKGPIVSSLDGFIAYHQNEAWHWETLALTRARVITAIATEPNHKALAFEQQTSAGLAAVIETPRNAALLKQAVIEMAAMVHQSHPPRHELDCKYRVGGAFDLDFICQYLVLIWAPCHQGLAEVPESSLDLLDRLHRGGALTETQNHALKAACEFYQSLQLLLRLTVGG